MNKKLLNKYKGPYIIKKVLENDRYFITDIEGFQNTQKPFKAVFDPTLMKKWVPRTSHDNLNDNTGNSLSHSDDDDDVLGFDGNEWVTSKLSVDSSMK